MTIEKKVKLNIKLLKEKGAPIIIVGAVQESEAVANACRDFGIVISAFCDSEPRKSKDILRMEVLCDLEVIHTPSLPKRYPNARFIIACQHVQDVVEQLTGYGYDDFYSPLELIENYNVSKFEHTVSSLYMEKRLAVCKKTHKSYFDDNQIYMRSIDIMVTTKCSLKCNNCSNLMQYYTSPEHTEDKKILEALKIIDENVDGISEFRIIGGEPLMNKGWANIVTKINERHPEGQIFIYTNGTILPKEDQIKSFDSKLVNFIITDYGKLSRNADKMTDLLNKHNISYDRSLAQGWVDCSSIKHHKRSIEDNMEVFKQCCVKYVYTLLEGKLYRCPFIANAANLRAIPDNPANYVDLFSEKKNIKQEMKRLVKVAKFFPGCDFCVGRPYDPTSSVGYDGKGIIEAGEQVSQVIPYKLYE